MSRRLSNLLFLLALGSAFFEHGGVLYALFLVQAAVVVWVALDLLAAYSSGAGVRHTALPVILGLLWAWLGIATGLAQIGFMATLAFWSLGSVPLVYAATVLEPRYPTVPNWNGRLSFLILVVLMAGAYGLWQRLGLHELARSVFLNPRSHEAFLNLLLFPTVALWLGGMVGGHRRRIWLLGGVVALVSYAVAANGGRGSGLALWVGIAILLFLVRRLVPRKALAMVFALMLGIYGLAALTVPHSVARATSGLRSSTGEALALVARPEDSVARDETGPSQRLLIWRGALELLHHSPWYGSGPGSFWLAYPPYRPTADATAGQHAHNDYLEILIELGWPGVGLLLLIMVCAARSGLRAVHSEDLAKVHRIEAAGLLAGLATVAVHSLFSFNFYVLPILIVMGLYLGRLQLLADAGHELRVWRPARWVGRPAYRLIILGLAAIPLSQLAGIAAADAWVRQANHEMARGEFEVARTHLWRAFNAFETDRPLLELARIYTRGVRTTSDPAARRKFFEAGKKVLDQAREVNPLRAYTPLLRAALIEIAGPALDPAWERHATRAYRRALALDPRQWMARRGLAESLLRGNRRGEAVRVVEDGLRYTPLAERGALPFYGLAVRLRMERGDSTGAAEVYQDMKRIARELHLTRESLAAFGIKTWLPALEALSAKADSS